MKTKGLSYMEMLIALSLFAILFLTLLPILNQAGRNLAAAEEGYNAHLAAQSIMLAVRNEVRDTNTALFEAEAKKAAEEIAESRKINTYRVWIFYECECVFLNNVNFCSSCSPALSFGSPCAPAENPELSGLSDLSLSENTVAIIVAVWNEQGGMAGRAVGIKNL
jgi:competence protein ComGC